MSDLVSSLMYEYFSNNKSTLSMFLFVCCFQYILNIIVTSQVYSKFFKTNTDMSVNLRNVCILWVAKYLTSSLKAHFEERLFSDFAAFIRHALFSKYIASNQIIFDDVNVAADVRDMLELSRMMRDVFAWTMQSLIPTTAFLLIIVIYFFIRFPTVGGITFFSSVVNAWLIRQSYSQLLVDMDKKHAQTQHLLDKFEESLQNLMNIMINNKSEECIVENRQREDEYMPIAVEEQREVKTTASYMRMNTYLSSAISLYVLYKNAEFENFLNCLFMFTFYISTLETLFEDLPNMVRLVSKIEMLQCALTKKIFHKLKIQSPVYRPNCLKQYRGGIHFENVSFSYGGAPVIQNLNWMIQPGERVALVAKSGSGKTTLMKLLLKFYQPQQGRIFADNIPVDEIDPRDIRDQINYINQKTLLFGDTILANMKYGNSLNDEDLLYILKQYNLMHIFRDCDKSPDTCLLQPVEPNGTNMSMGMQKVIFLVRGLLRNHSPVCILDEPLSSIDPSSRASVINMIRDLVGNRTLIIITHDDVSSIVHRTVNLLELQNKKPS